MPIGEFSQRTGLSAKRLRSYAAAGLLPPAAIDPNSGYRYYTPGQVREATVIDGLRRAGIPLAEIATLLRAPSAETLDRWKQRLEAESQERRGALDDVRRLLGAATDNRKEPMTTFEAIARSENGR